MRQLFLFICICVLISGAKAQEHAFPIHQGLGVPGPEPRSFLIGWYALPGAVAYEYILTDNFLCFSGCAGDTREGLVYDTVVIEYELLRDKQYYWITRAVFDNGERGPWSLISEFWSWTPPLEPLLQPAPHPVQGPLRLQVDWGANPEADLLELSIFSLDGSSMMVNQEIRPSSLSRKEELVLQEPFLPAGMYLLRILPKNNDGRQFLPVIRKMQVQK